MSDEDVQAQVRKWQRQQPDLIHCEATKQTLTLTQCRLYQEMWIHKTPPNKDRGEKKEQTNPRFWRCKASGCEHYRERKTPEGINRRMYTSFRRLDKSEARAAIESEAQ